MDDDAYCCFDLRRRAAKPSRPRPRPIRANESGSGTAVIDTPSSSENGGRPSGVPTARKLSSWLVLVAVNVTSSCFQPVKP